MKKLILYVLFSLPLIVACSDDENEMKVDLTNAVIEFIDTRYNGAQIRGSEYENNGLLEVEIRHDGKIKDVYFDSQNGWVYTSWDVRVPDLPVEVKNALTAAYPDYRIDEADFIEREDGDRYAVEIEKGKLSVMVYVSPEGEILE
jgi:major membrane immunogen (membrane-anchored lipoprotein)